MKKKQKIDKKKFNNFFWFYYIFIIIISFITLIQGIYSQFYNTIPLILYGFSNSLGTLSTILGICALISFTRHKYPKITLITPIILFIFLIISIPIVLLGFIEKQYLSYTFWENVEYIVTLPVLLISIYVFNKFRKEIKNLKEHNNLIKRIILKIGLIFLILIINLVIMLFSDPLKNSLILNLLFSGLFIFFWYLIYKVIKSI